jgi:hypothetical protein
VDASVPVLRYDLVVALDYGQFGLCGNPSPLADPIGLLERATAGSGIASDDYGLLVCSPHQNNFRMPLAVELCRDEPVADSDDWEEVFESVLTVRGGELRYDSPTMEGATCRIPDGRYAVRISGRGFLNRGWPGSTTPPDEWRVQLWPSGRMAVDVTVKSWSPGGAA